MTAEAGSTVLLDFADETSVVQTRFAHHGADIAAGHRLASRREAESDAARLALEAPLPEGLADYRRIVFLGAGWTIGLAAEAALKLREAAGAWTESYPAMEYRHGPITAASDETLVWPIGAVDATVLRSRRGRRLDHRPNRRTAAGCAGDGAAGSGRARSGPRP